MGYEENPLRNWRAGVRPHDYRSSFPSFSLNHFEKWNARLLPNYCPECERGPRPFATRRLYEPEVDELFLTHLLVLPSTRIF
jgi:hypothetical protein